MRASRAVRAFRRGEAGWAFLTDTGCSTAHIEIEFGRL